jgi:hypothetical protein
VKPSAYQQPSIRSYIREIEPRVIASARATSDAGFFRIAADLSEIFATDARVRAALSQRVDGVLTLPKRFEHGSKRVLKALDEDFADLAADSEHGLWIKRALMSGLGLVQLIWQRNARGRIVPRIESWPATGLSLTRDYYELEVSRGYGTFDRIPLVLGGEGKWQWHLLTPFSASRPMFFGLWNTLAEICSSKKFAEKDWAAYSEVHGRAFKVLSQESPPPDGAAQLDGRDLVGLVDDVQSATAGSAIALPSGVKLELLESMSTTWATFPKQADYANSEIAIAILGQNLTTEVKGGSYSAAQVHAAVSRVCIVATAQLDEQALLPIMRRWEELNFGSSDIEFHYDTTDPNESAVRATTLKSYGDGLASLAAVPGLGADLRDIAEDAEIPLLDEATTIPPTATESLSASSGIERHAIEGQKAIDAQSAGQLQAAIDPLLAKVTAALAAASSFDEFENALRYQIGAQDDPQKMKEVLSRAMMLATSIGAYSASQE